MYLHEKDGKNVAGLFDRKDDPADYRCIADSLFDWVEQTTMEG